MYLVYLFLPERKCYLFIVLRLEVSCHNITYCKYFQSNTIVTHNKHTILIGHWQNIKHIKQNLFLM